MKKLRSPALVLLILIFLMGTAIRFFNLGDIFLYRDEPIHSVRIDYQPLSFVTAHNNGSALFAVLVHFLLKWGPVTTMSRLPAAVFGSLAILIVFFAGSYFFSPVTGVLAAALVAFSPFCIQISQYSRGYSLFMLLSLLSLFFFFLAWETDSTKAWFSYVLATVLALYTHLMGFMILPVYAAFAAFTWILSHLKPSQPQAKAASTRRLLRFALFTSLTLFLVFLLYFPDQNVRDFISGSVDRVQTQVPFTYLWSYLIRKIPTQQLQTPGWFFGLMLAFLGAGLLSSLRSRLRLGALLSLYLFLPLTIFIAVNPREVNIQSADRYFIFVLPVLFILIAQGATALISVITRFLSRSKSLSPAVPAVTGILLVVVCCWQIAGFNHKHYYLHFWRLGSFPVTKDIQARLGQEVKQDSLVYFPDFPASGHTLVISPLTRDPEVRGSEAIIRRGWSTEAKNRDFMIYRSAGSLKMQIRSPLGIYAVSRSQPEDRVSVQYFGKAGALLSENWLDLVSEFLSKNVSGARRRELLLQKARIQLLSGKETAAYQTLSEARQLKLSSSDRLPIPTHPLYSLLDPLMGLDQDSLQAAFFDTLYIKDLAEILFNQAEDHLLQSRHEAALKAYQECLLLSQAYKQEISGRFTRIANTYLVNEEPGKALALYQEAARMNPEHRILSWLQLECFRQLSDWDRVQVALKRLIPSESLQKILHDRTAADRPFVLIDRKASRFRIIFRAPLRGDISGKITAGKKLDEVLPEFFKKDDLLKVESQEISWAFKMDKRRIKILEFTAAPGSRIDLDLKFREKRQPQHIFLLKTGDSPDSLPFPLDAIPAEERK